MAPEQAHEQNNKKVKTYVGTVGILNSPSTLLKWAISGPEIMKLIDSTGLENIDYEEGDE